MGPNRNLLYRHTNLMMRNWSNLQASLTSCFRRTTVSEICLVKISECQLSSAPLKSSSPQGKPITFTSDLWAALEDAVCLAEILVLNSLAVLSCQTHPLTPPPWSCCSNLMLTTRWCQGAEEGLVICITTLAGPSLKKAEYQALKPFQEEWKAREEHPFWIC